MKSILITGGRGYIATAIQRTLLNKYYVTTVTREEFDLSNLQDTARWFDNKYFDVVIHTAITGGSRLNPDSADVLDSNLKMYYNLLNQRKSFNRFINIGSGAEIHHTNTPYGISKHIIRQSVLSEDNFYNIRVFAVFDENELDSRFIKANLYRYINKEPMLIHQNKQMDFFYMNDFVSVIEHYINNPFPIKEFNCTYTDSPYLQAIAEYINTLSDYIVDIHYEQDGIASSYTGEFTPIDLNFIGLHTGISSVHQTLSCKK